jgi:hypothetical protein
VHYVHSARCCCCGGGGLVLQHQPTHGHGHGPSGAHTRRHQSATAPCALCNSQLGLPLQRVAEFAGIKSERAERHRGTPARHGAYACAARQPCAGWPRKRRRQAWLAPPRLAASRSALACRSGRLAAPSRRAPGAECCAQMRVQRCSAGPLPVLPCWGPGRCACTQRRAHTSALRPHPCAPHLHAPGPAAAAPRRSLPRARRRKKPSLREPFAHAPPRAPGPLCIGYRLPTSATRMKLAPGGGPWEAAAPKQLSRRGAAQASGRHPTAIVSHALNAQAGRAGARCLRAL